MVIIVICFLNLKVIISKKLVVIDSKEVFLKGNVCDFSVYYNSIDISDILNIHNYLMGNISI